MKILVTGSNGQVGQALSEQIRNDVYTFNRTELDITDEASVRQVITNCLPDIVINAAAYTAVDRAEENPEHAFAVNRDGVKNLAHACKMAQIPMIHISTDYVFNGFKKGAYSEEDTTDALSVYGRSKLAGEIALREILPNHLIIRTSWVFSNRGNNFVKTMLGLAKKHRQLKVVSDQYGCPTSANAIAKAILHIVPELIKSSKKTGTYHFCQPQPTNWHHFAQAIITQGKKVFDLEVGEILAITSDEYPTIAKRPRNSVLETSKFTKTFNYQIPSWQSSLIEMIAMYEND